MERRKLGARGLLLVLVPSALAMLVGGGLLMLERHGIVTLRRVPNVVVAHLHDAKGDAVALLNSDVTPGAFLLKVWSRPVWQGRVWVPARSIVLRHPEEACVVLSHGGVEVALRAPRPTAWIQLAPRGARSALEWTDFPCPPATPRKEEDVVLVVEPRHAHVSLVQGRGVTVESDPRSVLQGTSSASTTAFRWNGSAPIMVDIGADAPEPTLIRAAMRRTVEIRDDELTICDRQPGDTPDPWTRTMQAYDPDLTVIDER